MTTLAIRRPRLEAAISSAVVVAGMAFLISRTSLGGSMPTRLTVVTLGFVAMAAASIVVPAPTNERASDGLTTSAVVLGVGLLAVVLASQAAGTPVPTGWGAFAVVTSVIAAIAEEALFRRVAYARLERFGPVVAIVGSAVLFTVVHLPAYGTSTLPVDAGAALLFGWQRWASGTWTVPAATHAFANLVTVLR